MKKYVSIIFCLLGIINISADYKANDNRLRSLYDDDDTLVTIVYPEGWALFSVPVNPIDNKVSDFFPGIQKAFYYEPNRRYMPVSTVSKGKGHWIKLPNPQIIQFLGKKKLSDTINVKKGYNLLSSLSVPISKSLIRTIPTGIFISMEGPGEDGTGKQSSILYPGYGYWVKVSQDGKVVLSNH